MRYLVLFLILVPALSLAGPRDAKADRPAVEIDFGEVDVRAKLTGPTVQLVEQPDGLTFTPMVRLRTDFDREIRESVAAIR